MCDLATYTLCPSCFLLSSTYLGTMGPRGQMSEPESPHENDQGGQRRSHQVTVSESQVFPRRLPGQEEVAQVQFLGGWEALTSGRRARRAAAGSGTPVFEPGSPGSLKPSDPRATFFLAGFICGPGTGVPPTVFSTLPVQQKDPVPYSCFPLSPVQLKREHPRSED